MLRQFSKLKASLLKSRELGVYLATDISGKAITFITPLLLAAQVSNERYGVYSLSLVIVYLFSSLFSQAIQNPYVVLAQEEYKARGRSSRSFTAAFTMLIAGLILGVTIVTLLDRPMAGFVGEIGEIFPLLITGFLGVAAKIFFDGLYISIDRKVLYGIFSFTGGAFGLAYFVGATAVGVDPVYAILQSLLFGNLLGGFILLPFSNWRRIVPFEWHLPTFVELWKQVRWVALGVTSMYLINWGDNLVLRAQVSVGEIGVYNFGYQFFKAFILLATSLVYFFIPNAVKRLEDVEYMKNYLTKFRLKLNAIWLLGNFAAGCLITLLIQFLYADKYSAAIPVLWLLLVASSTLMYRRLYEPILSAQKQFKFIHLVNIVFVCVNLGLDVLLVPIYGINGAAIATAIAYSLVVIIYEVYFRLKVKPQLNIQ